jgi:hypothetical protein
MGNVLISQNFLIDTYRLVALLDGRIDDPVVEDLRIKIQAEIEKKLDAQERRQSFSGYKTATAGSPVRESARRKYLDATGVHPDWRSSEEIQP